MSKQRGIILIISYIVIILFLTLIGIFVFISISEKGASERKKELSVAFYLAEAGIDRALNELRQDYKWGGLSSVSLGEGEYSVSVSSEGNRRIIVSSGFIPAEAKFRVKRRIEAVIERVIPPNFYDNAIYCSGEVDLNGNAYSVTGNVLYFDEIDNPTNITGEVVQDTSIRPLSRLNFKQLYEMSKSQNNVYDEARLEAVQRGIESFPASFWYIEPSDPEDPTTGKPNIVYIETDLKLRGNIGAIGGFYIVAGDILTNPENTYNATINGNGKINGCVYTKGEFEINGGAGGLNVFGGVWAGEEAELNGNAHIVYNQIYMEAIKALDLHTDFQIISWREL